MAAVAGSPMTSAMLTMCATGKYNHYSGEPGTAMKQMMNWMRRAAPGKENSRRPYPTRSDVQS